MQPQRILVIAFALVASCAGGNLKEDLDEFKALIPIDDIKKLALEYIAGDPEFQEQIYALLDSEDLKNVITTIDAAPQFIDLLNFMKANGVENIYDIINKIHDAVGLPPLSGRHQNLGRDRTGTGLAGFLRDALALLPRAEIKALFEEKLESSPVFLELIEKLRSDDFKTVVETVRATDSHARLEQKARDIGIDVDKVLAFLNRVLGW